MWIAQIHLRKFVAVAWASTTSPFHELHYMDCFVTLLSFLLLFSALSAGGNRVLNANNRDIRRSDMIQRVNFRASGVRWKYRRNSTAETLSASGTLTQVADVEVLVGRTGNSVQFTYEYVVYSTTIQPLTTTQPPTTEPTPTTRPTSTITRMFSATNQSSGKQWVDHCVMLCHVMLWQPHCTECWLALYGSVLVCSRHL